MSDLQTKPPSTTGEVWYVETFFIADTNEKFPLGDMVVRAPDKDAAIRHAFDVFWDSRLDAASCRQAWKVRKLARTNPRYFYPDFIEVLKTRLKQLQQQGEPATALAVSEAECRAVYSVMGVWQTFTTDATGVSKESPISKEDAMAILSQLPEASFNQPLEAYGGIVRQEHAA